MQEKIRRKFNFPPKAIILSIVFLDVLGIGIIVPVLPYYVETFNAPDIVVSSLFMAFSLFAFFSAPILGMISDRHGRRPVLLVSLVSTAAGWFIFAFSRNIFGLFLGRIIDGLAAGNMSTAQNYLIDISKNKEEQTKNIGQTAAIFGIGFVIGPALGGLLSLISLKLPFIVIGGMALLSTVLAYFFLPETNREANKKAIPLNPFAPIWKACANKTMFPLYFAWLAFATSLSLTQSVFALYIGQKFLWTVITAGSLLAVIGVIISLNQAFFITKFWLRFFSSSSLLVWLLLPFALGYFIMSLPHKFLFVAGAILTAICYSTLRVILNSQIVNFYDKNEQGETVGVMTSLISLAMILGPMLGGSSYEIKEWMPFVLNGTMLLVAFVMVSRTYRTMPEDNIKKLEGVI